MFWLLFLVNFALFSYFVLYAIEVKRAFSRL